jgi:hypothetical protein
MICSPRCLQQSASPVTDWLEDFGAIMVGCGNLFASEAHVSVTWEGLMLCIDLLAPACLFSRQ